MSRRFFAISSITFDASSSFAADYFLCCRQRHYATLDFLALFRHFQPAAISRDFLLRHFLDYCFIADAIDDTYVFFPSRHIDMRHFSFFFFFAMLHFLLFYAAFFLSDFFRFR